MSYLIYRDKEDVFRCNNCHSQLQRNEKNKLPGLCPVCQATLDIRNKEPKCIARVRFCPKCNKTPDLITYEDCSFIGDEYAYKIKCLNCYNQLETNAHFSFEGLEAEWNKLVENYEKLQETNEQSPDEKANFVPFFDLALVPDNLRKTITIDRKVIEEASRNHGFLPEPSREACQAITDLLKDEPVNKD